MKYPIEELWVHLFFEKTSLQPTASEFTKQADIDECLLWISFAQFEQLPWVKHSLEELRPHLLFGIPLKEPPPSDFPEHLDVGECALWILFAQFKQLPWVKHSLEHFGMNPTPINE